jgi:hypothetical protein
MAKSSLMTCDVSGNVVRAMLAVASFGARLAFAGPPYVTDDPVPTERGHWEIYQFVGGGHAQGVSTGEAGLDFNYGGARDLQLTVVIPAAYERSSGTHIGLGVIETAAKFRFVHEEPGSARPDIAVFPRLFWPTAAPRFAAQRLNLLLPIWLGKTLGNWSVFGGGGYQFNPGRDARDFWLTGIEISHAAGARLSIGAEIYHRSSDAPDGMSFTGINLGMVCSLSEHWSLLASAGPGIRNAGETAQYTFYLALRSDY